MIDEKNPFKQLIDFCLSGVKALQGDDEITLEQSGTKFIVRRDQIVIDDRKSKKSSGCVEVVSGQ